MSCCDKGWWGMSCHCACQESARILWDKNKELLAEVGRLQAIAESQAEVIKADPSMHAAMIAKFVYDPKHDIDLLEVMKCGHYLANMDDEKDECKVCAEFKASKEFEADWHAKWLRQQGDLVEADRKLTKTRKLLRQAMEVE